MEAGMEEAAARLERLRQRLAARGLQVADEELPGLVAMVEELEIMSRALRHERPFDLEPFTRLFPAGGEGERR